jgi:hypothetical protein
MNKQVTGNKSGSQNKQNAGGKQGNPDNQPKQSNGNKPNTRPSAQAKSAASNATGSNAQSRQGARQSERQSSRQQQKQEQLRKQKQAARNRGIVIGSIIAAVIIVFVGIGIFVYMNNNTQSASTTETVVNPSYPPVDGIYCDSLEQTTYHYHALLAMYINGKQAALPSQIGIAPDGSCYYWLHTHDSSGVIHIEAPANHSFTLGNFLDEWSQHFSSLGYPAQLNSPNWQVWINGKVYTGDLHNIVLKSHEIITLAYNSPGVKPVTTYDWNGL